MPCDDEGRVLAGGYADDAGVFDPEVFPLRERDVVELDRVDVLETCMYCEPYRMRLEGPGPWRMRIAPPFTNLSRHRDRREGDAPRGGRGGGRPAQAILVGAGGAVGDRRPRRGSPTSSRSQPRIASLASTVWC